MFLRSFGCKEPLGLAAPPSRSPKKFPGKGELPAKPFVRRATGSRVVCDVAPPKPLASTPRLRLQKADASQAAFLANPSSGRQNRPLRSALHAERPCTPLETWPGDVQNSRSGVGQRASRWGRRAAPLSEQPPRSESALVQRLFPALRFRGRCSDSLSSHVAGPAENQGPATRQPVEREISFAALPQFGPLRERCGSRCGHMRVFHPPGGIFSGALPCRERFYTLNASGDWGAFTLGGNPLGCICNRRRSTASGVISCCAQKDSAVALILV